MNFTRSAVSVILLSITVIFLTTPSWSKTVQQKNTKNRVVQSDQEDVSETPDFQAILSFSMPNLRLGIQHYTEDSQSDEIRYEPNVKMSWGVDLSYLGYGLSYAMELHQAEKDEDKYGKTSYRDIQIYHYSSRWGADVYFQRYKGYYLHNPEAYGRIEGDSVSLRPDMKMYSAGCNLYYSFDENFSLNNAMKYVFTGNGGRSSFLMMVSPNYFMVDSESSLIPDSEEADYGDDAGFRKGEYYSLSLSPGYAYTNKFSNDLFFTFIVFGGIGGMSKQSVTDDGESKNFAMCIKANVKFGFGYDSTNFFCGVTGLGDGTSTRDPLADSSTGVMSYVIKAEVFAGIRL